MMTPQGLSENLRPLDSQTDPIILDRRDRRLRNTRSLRQLILAHPLQLSDDSHRLSDRNRNALLCRTVSLHSRPPIIMRRKRLNIEGKVLRHYSVDDPPLQTETRGAPPAPLPSQRLVAESLVRQPLNVLAGSLRSLHRKKRLNHATILASRSRRLFAASWISLAYTINSYGLRNPLNFVANAKACDTGTSSSSPP